MPDSNLNTSISAMRTTILNDLPTATVAELVDLSRAAKSLNLANDSTVETAINNRAVALINGGATQAEIIKISQAVKSVLSPATFANNIANFTTITSSLVPDTDVSYDLGTSSNRFNDIYLDGNTIDLGGQTIKSTATGIEVPEITIGSGTNKVKLSANSSGKLEQVGTNSGGVVQDTVTGSGPASTAVTNLSDLTAISSPATGQSVLVTSTNKLYIYNGTGWYLIAEVTNLSPTAITGLNATYDLATDGTATTITLNSTDPEGATLTWSHAVTTGTLGSTATITNVDNVFTITPSTTQADAGSFSVTFSASDGSQAATSASDFSLNFAPPASSVLFTTVGTHNWTVPAGLTSVSVVCIGAGGAHNSGHVGSDKSEFGGFVLAPSGWKNTSLTPSPSGTHLTAGFQGGAGGGVVGGGNGGGGGAAGYYGNGGNGATGGSCGKGGGGVGVYGGPNGPSPTGGGATSSSVGGTGQFGGTDGQGQGSNSSLPSYWLGHGGSFGGGGGHCSTTKIGGSGGSLGYGNNIPVTPGSVISVKVGGGVANGGPSGIPGMGAVRVMWGSGRSYPNTNVSNSYNVDAETTV